MKQELWFKKKTYGWGWTPANAKGWAVTLLHVAVVILYPWLIKQGMIAERVPVEFVIAGAVLLFLAIVIKTGEKPEWSWGKKQN